MKCITVELNTLIKNSRLEEINVLETFQKEAFIVKC